MTALVVTNASHTVDDGRLILPPHPVVLILPEGPSGMDSPWWIETTVALGYSMTPPEITLVLDDNGNTANNQSRLQTVVDEIYRRMPHPILVQAFQLICDNHVHSLKPSVGELVTC